MTDELRAALKTIERVNVGPVHRRLLLRLWAADNAEALAALAATPKPALDSKPHQTWLGPFDGSKHCNWTIEEHDAATRRRAGR